MDKIVSNDEIKLIAGIGGTANDALVDYHNRVATEVLAREVLRITDFASHAVSRERACPNPKGFLDLKDMPISTSGITIEDELLRSVTGYTFQNETNHPRRLRVIGSNSLPGSLPYEEVFVSYTAGYVLQDTLLILDNGSDILNTTITVLNRVTGVETAYTIVASGASGNQVNRGATATDTATALATAFGGTSSGATLTMPLHKSIVSTTIAAADGTLTRSDLPLGFKTAVALLAAGGIAEKERKGNVQSYRIGDKSVTFASERDYSTFLSCVKPYVSSYTRVGVFA